MLQKGRLIESAYSVFADFSKPEKCTEYLDLEDAEFNPILLSTTRRALTIEQIGTVSWGPIPSMNAEALAYFMPRLIELAVHGTLDRDGDAFYCHFIHAFHDVSQSGKYRLFGDAQKEIMSDTFAFLCNNYPEQLELEGWLSEARQAAVEWRPT
jgi:hypothetical protein